MDYSNGYIFPKDYVRDEEEFSRQDSVQKLEEERLARALAISAAQSSNTSKEEAEAEGKDSALLAVAMQV